MSDVTKKDWKLFQEKLGGWQENYMDRLIQEYITLLQSEAAPSQKFWAINNRIREDKKRPGVQLTLEKKRDTTASRLADPRSCDLSGRSFGFQ